MNHAKHAVSLVQNTAYTLTFSVILHVQGVFFFLILFFLSLFFFPKPKTPAVKPTASFPAKSAVVGGGGSRQPGPRALSQASLSVARCLQNKLKSW